MPGDASLPPNAPMTNGTEPVVVHGEADASDPQFQYESKLQPTFPPSQSLYEVCASLHSRVTVFLAATPADEVTRRTQEQTRISLDVIERALREYEFHELSLSYNGGKDCLVLLILYLAVIYTRYNQPERSNSPTANAPSTATIETTTRSTNFFPTTIPSIYAKPPDPFPAVTEFVESSSQEYHLDLVHISTNPGPRPNPLHQPSSTTTSSSLPPPIATKPTGKRITIRDAFAQYTNTHPSVKAIFVGTRRTDPHGGHLTHFDPTDHNWPPFMRIHPVIDWRLSEIWCFLRAEQLQPMEYCAMYDMGYTSLGGVGDTLKNPRLRYFVKQEVQDEGKEKRLELVEKYRPAYELTEDLEERLGRE